MHIQYAYVTCLTFPLALIILTSMHNYSLEGLMLTLKLQYFGHLMQRTDSLEQNPDAGKD